MTMLETGAMTVSPSDQRGRTPTVLTVAGSDSGGGAGIQADLKTFAAWGMHGTSAITCVTAQNPDCVRAIEALSPSLVSAQIAAVCEAFPVAAVKTGMLYSAALIAATADALQAAGTPNLVVDPVMVATSGGCLLHDAALETLCARLLPLARVVTPNVPEAEVLIGQKIETRATQIDAAKHIATRFGTACVVKGGHLIGLADEASGASIPILVDVLVTDSGAVHQFRTPVIKARETHGTGCTFAAALAAGLALQLPLPEAVRRATDYVSLALRRAITTGAHAPLGWLKPE